MREFVVNKNDADQRVDKYLSKSLKRLPKSLMYKYIRNKKIKVNRQRCEISQRLNAGILFRCISVKSFLMNSWILHLCRHQSCRMWFMKMIIY